MLYELFTWLDETRDFPGAGLFNFVSFRAGTAIILSLIIGMLFGGRLIKLIQRFQMKETVRDLGLEGQMEKAGTPTMGGLIIIMSILVPTLLMADLKNVYVQVMLLSTIWMGVIGFIDDYIKVVKKDKEGLRGKFKVLGQVGLGLIVALVMLFHEGVLVRVDYAEAKTAGYEIKRLVYEEEGSESEPLYAIVHAPLTDIPFVKDKHVNYAGVLAFASDNIAQWGWILFIPWVIFIVTAVSNAANLTDGLDGLATGVSAIIGAALGLFAYVSSNVIASDYLNILFLPDSQELVIFSAAFMGATIGFLWYNAYPAQIFMGDTGSLTLGGVIAALSILLRKELLIPVLCGIFLVENLSVVLQVAYFKYTKKKYGEGRRIFKMSPLHHHFQKLGMPEPKIVVRFWIVGILLAVATLLTLKIR